MSKTNKTYKVWEPNGIREDFTVKAESKEKAAIKALKELGYDIDQLREGEGG